METTLCDANLYPRGILTVQFQAKLAPSTADHVNSPSELSGLPGEGLQSRHVNPSIEQPAVDHRHIEDAAKRELRLKATLDRYGQESGRGTNGTVIEAGVATAASILAPPVTSSAAASVGRVREERSLEVDGERVRHRELALQAAAKRMTEASQIFREGLMPDAGEAGGGGGFCTPSDVLPGPATSIDDDTRFVSEEPDSKGKQVARAGQLSEVEVHDVGDDFSGFRGRTSRPRSRLLSPSPSRPEKMLRTDEASSTSSVGANHNLSLFPIQTRYTPVALQ